MALMLEANKTYPLEFIERTPLSGLLIIKREPRYDERGFFQEIVRLSDFESIGIEFKPVQINHSSSKPRVIRGLHAEAWNKLVYPVNGEMFAAIVDIRPDSETFGNSVTFNFGAENRRRALFIPKGFANSICVTGKTPVDYIYLVDSYFTGQDTRAIAWDDPDLAIDWPVKDPIISRRDRDNPTLRQMFSEKFK